MSEDEVDSDRGVDQLDTEMPPEMKQIQEFMNTTFPGEEVIRENFKNIVFRHEEKYTMKGLII